MPKVKLLRNTGTAWHRETGVPLADGKPFEEGKEYDVSKESEAILIKGSLIEVRGVAEAAPLRGVSKKGDDK